MLPEYADGRGVIAPPTLIEQETVPIEPFTERKFAAAYVDRGTRYEPLGITLHRHIEGWLCYRDLRGVADELGIELQQETWDEIHKSMMGSRKKDINTFIARLSTRWLRLIFIKGLLQGIEAEKIYGVIFNKGLDKAEKEGLGTLELMMSQMALVLEGNILEIPNVDAEQEKLPPWLKLLPEEEKVLKEFDFLVQAGINKVIRDRVVDPADREFYRIVWQKTQRLQAALVARDLPKTEEELQFYPTEFRGKAPTIGLYAETFKKTVQARLDRFVWAGEKTGDSDTRCEVGVVACLRREQLTEQPLANIDGKLTDKGRELAEVYIDLYRRGIIHAVNMAGVESREEFRLRNFDAFFRYMKAAGVPLTVHAGELTPDNGDLAYDNLHYAIMELGVAGIGHAVRLFDDTPRMRWLLFMAIVKGIRIEVNLTSNYWTGVARKLQDHPILKALRGEHSLFRTQAMREALMRIIVFCDDDPIIAGANNKQPLAKEFATLTRHVGNMGFKSPREMLYFFKWFGDRLAVWRRKQILGAFVPA